MSKPTARDFYLTQIAPKFSRCTYEEYVLQTTIAKGRLKRALDDDFMSYYRKHPLSALQHSNSIEVDYVCKNVIELDPDLRPFLSQCFVGVSVETAINAGAFYSSDLYDGRIIQIDAGLPNWLEFFLAPFVTLSFTLDSETSPTLDGQLPKLLQQQMDALTYLRSKNTVHSDINKLERPSFLTDEMWLEHTYYKQSALAFVLLHEIGHHILAHTDQSYLPLVSADVHEYSSKSMTENHRMEFEADFFAARTLAKWSSLLGHATGGMNNDTMVNAYLLGPLLALISLCFLSESFEDGSASHPSTLDRLMAYIRFYLERSTAFNQGYGLYITRTYASLLFSDASSILSSWEPWWTTVRNNNA